MQPTKEQLAGLAGTCATIRVVADNEEGYAIINAHDYDENIHEMLDESGTGGTGINYGKMTVAELTAACAEHNLDIPAGSRKGDLIALLENSN